MMGRKLRQGLAHRTDAVEFGGNELRNINLAMPGRVIDSPFLYSTGNSQLKQKAFENEVSISIHEQLLRMNFYFNITKNYYFSWEFFTLNSYCYE